MSAPLKERTLCSCLHEFNKRKDLLYLVTDSDLLPKSASSLEDHVEQLIQGGVDIVQIREKSADTRDFVAKASNLLRVCRRHGVPLIVNDRIDVALAIGADGVHLGQDDMSCSLARQLLGNDCVIGVSVNTPQEASEAIDNGADYLGIGAVYDTSTKKLTKPTLGTSGVQEIIRSCSQSTEPTWHGWTVAIGGLNASNIDRVLFASQVEVVHETGMANQLNGIAIVSALMASSEPQKAARELKDIMRKGPVFNCLQRDSEGSTDLRVTLMSIIDKVRLRSPLVHQMTNNVVKNFSANVTIAIGASPIMSEVREEAAELARINGAFLLNMGMIGDSNTPLFAAQQNNKNGRPIVLDPVGCGATSYRRQAVKNFLDNAYFDVIKGNDSELSAILGLETIQKGVDNSGQHTLAERIQIAKALAQRHRNVVVMTGKEDIVSNGRTSVVVKSGSKWLGQVTGSGCALGSVIASCLAVRTDGKFAAALAGVVLYGLAAERAEKESTVQGPGTFLPAFVDSLNRLTTAQGLLEQTLANRDGMLDMLR